MSGCILVMWILANVGLSIVQVARAQPWFNVHVIQEYLNLTGKAIEPSNSADFVPFYLQKILLNSVYLNFFFIKIHTKFKRRLR